MTMRDDNGAWVVSGERDTPRGWAAPELPGSQAQRASDLCERVLAFASDVLGAQSPEPRTGWPAPSPRL